MLENEKNKYAIENVEDNCVYLSLNKDHKPIVSRPDLCKDGFLNECREDHNYYNFTPHGSRSSLDLPKIIVTLDPEVDIAVKNGFAVNVKTTLNSLGKIEFEGNKNSRSLALETKRMESQVLRSGLRE